jgi:hypothetical protein
MDKRVSNHPKTLDIRSDSDELLLLKSLAKNKFVTLLKPNSRK